MSVNSFRDLLVWQKGMNLAKDAYQITIGFPRHEVYGLASQVQRAAVSVPANIAEGHARCSTKEFLHHLSIARGSLAELETLLTLASDLNYCESEIVHSFTKRCEELGRMMTGLRKRLKEKTDRP